MPAKVTGTTKLIDTVKCCNSDYVNVEDHTMRVLLPMMVSTGKKKQDAMLSDGTGLVNLVGRK